MDDYKGRNTLYRETTLHGVPPFQVGALFGREQGDIGFAEVGLLCCGIEFLVAEMEHDGSPANTESDN